MKLLLEKYLTRIFEVMKRGDAREESYYSALEDLLRDYSLIEKKKYEVTTLPKKTEAGNPDFRIWDGRNRIVGYIEAKDPSVGDLGAIEGTEQLKRYRETFPNLILTNFFEFRLYRKGELVKKVSVGRPFTIYKLQVVPPAENENDFSLFLEFFFAFTTPKTTTAKQLAVELAKRTRFLRDQVIAEELRENAIEGVQTLEAYHAAFKNHLIGSLTPQAFSDLFAQTIAYGLFAARSRATDGFSRQTAFEYIPKTIGILKDVFRFISSAEVPKQMEWIVDDIASILAAADVQKIIEGFHREQRGRDPIVHFYETFLAEYDPAEREKKGVYYTPEPVVDYIVRSVHSLLKERFSKQDGLASENVTVLDPAAGTLTFEAAAVREAVAEYQKKYGEGGIRELLKDRILRNFYAFELMMAPYAVGHLKMGLVFDEYRAHLTDEERFRLFLTNTLEFQEEKPEGLPGVFERTIAEESKRAFEVKEKVPVMVIFGNPPYSGHSENKSPWILEKIKDYKKVDGKPLGEKNPKWLQDDYVKFYRFAQWKIEQAGQGILGFITNHAWLDNPTFRGMRASLLNTFDEIYILNLHGNARKKEKTPTGGKDENVFDIQAGVAIAISVKNGSAAKRVFYQDVWGLREEKYQYLENHDISSTEWESLTPHTPQYYLVPKGGEGVEEYEKFSGVNEIFPLSSVGVVTARDNLTIQPAKEKMWNTVLRFLQLEPEAARSAYALGKDANDWKVSLAREDLKQSGPKENFIVPILYRPFDVRYTYYTGNSRGFICRPRSEVMGHMLKPNLAIVLCRQFSGDVFQHALVTDKLVESSFVSNKTKEIGYVFPLYLHNKDAGEQKTIFDGQEKLDLKGTQHTLRDKDGRIPNVNPAVFEKLERVFGKTVAAEELFFYIYGVVYMPTYRAKYVEFLKSDFPRIPFTSDHKVFNAVVALGKELVDLHLLRAEALNQPTTKFEGGGDGKVEERRYVEEEQRIYVNAVQYFTGITLEMWNYYIGGYQVLDKWLKDRKREKLSSEDVARYCRVATAIAKTIEIQKELNKLYPKIETSLLESK